MMDTKEYVIRITVRGWGRFMGFLGEDGRQVSSRSSAQVFTLKSVADGIAKAWNDHGDAYTYTVVPRLSRAVREDLEAAEKVSQAVQ